MRVRKKLIVLHTLFTLALAAILLVTLGPSLTRLVHVAEVDKAATILEMVTGQNQALHQVSGSVVLEGVAVHRGPAAEKLLSAAQLLAARSRPGEPIDIGRLADESGRKPGSCVAVWLPNARAGSMPGSGELVAVEVSIARSRAAAGRLFALIVAVLLAVYILVAAALELLVLPGALYAPIERLLRADRAVQDGRPTEELIADSQIPGDEFGAIMRSRNASVLALRASERQLGEALEELEMVASEMKRKNHLIETARRNLEGADRLASLGMMSAGIAHELNTPLTVLKGLTDRLADRPGHRATPQEAALMRRVVGRLERLGESLLDFARVREPRAEPVNLERVVSEAITLVRLDRKGHVVEYRNAVSAGLVVLGDADRLVQVFVNLVRNAADAVVSVPMDQRVGGGLVSVRAQANVPAEELGAMGTDDRWVVVRVEDTGPGLDPSVLPRLFEPFFSTRLDAAGTGLGLAVAEGIIREHGGVLVARNREDHRGAVFEITLPAGTTGGTGLSEARDEQENER